LYDSDLNPKRIDNGTDGAGDYYTSSWYLEASSSGLPNLSEGDYAIFVKE